MAVIKNALVAREAWAYFQANKRDKVRLRKWGMRLTFRLKDLKFVFVILFGEPK